LFELGCRSVPLIAASGFAVGIVLSMHTRASLARFGAESLISGRPGDRAGSRDGTADRRAVAVRPHRRRHRRGAGGAMKVTEQIDALEACAVDSFRYLVVTRVVACVIALPILTTIMNVSGMLGGFAAETAFTGMRLRTYLQQAFSR
jgi:phospholipid/cholesterol/gamma-HCH transport system permease protein